MMKAVATSAKYNVSITSLLIISFIPVYDHHVQSE